MNAQQVLEVLREVGAVITNSHLVYASGRHGSAYVNKDAVYPHTRQASMLARAIAERFFFGKVIDAVVAPAVAGCILSSRVADHLCALTGRDVLAIYADKDGDNFVIKRGQDKLIAGKSVLVVEDVLTTGASARKVVEEVRRLGCNVVGLGVLCNRGGVTPENVGGVPELTALVNVSLDSWEEADCPLCAQGVPINTDVGKGREFLAKRAGKS
ncbi:MAG: phosphoribosyltransferase family protein [bacterium]|nr:phosphoribosyltransferase family protein [bacterium]